MPYSEDAPTLTPRSSTQFATVKDFQEATNLSRHTILRLIERGELEARKIGRQIRIPWSALEKIGTPLRECAMTAASNNAAAPEWWTIQETASKLNCSSDLVRKLIRSGELDARKFGRIIRVRAASIEEAGKPLAVAGAR